MNSNLTGVQQSIKQQAQGRQKFVHEGQVVYEWEQTLEDVHMYVKLPSQDIKKTDLNIKICPKKITIGLKTQPPYIEGELWSSVDASNSYWYMENGELIFECTKMRKGETWDALIVGHSELNPILKGEIQKQIFLERLQEEHPQFDFSTANMSGMAPDPRTFLGGVSYDKK